MIGTWDCFLINSQTANPSILGSITSSNTKSNCETENTESVTYIGGCGDSPERVAEVNRINAEKAKKKAEQQRQYQEQAAAAAAQRRAMWERTAAAEALEKSFSNIGDLLKTRMVSAPAVTPEISLPAGANMFFLNL